MNRYEQEQRLEQDECDDKVRSVLDALRQRDEALIELAQLKAAIATPDSVWANILRGTIAMPGQINHLETRVKELADAVDATVAWIDANVPRAEHDLWRASSTKAIVDRVRGLG